MNDSREMNTSTGNIQKLPNGWAEAEYQQIIFNLENTTPLQRWLWVEEMLILLNSSNKKD